MAGMNIETFTKLLLEIQNNSKTIVTTIPFEYVEDPNGEYYVDNLGRYVKITDAVIAEAERTHTVLKRYTAQMKDIVNVDLHERKIELSKSSSYKNFLSVDHDHYAETIYFRCARYFDGVDLMKAALVVEYVNAAGESHVSPILIRDITTFPNEILFGWNIHGNATNTAGKIRFAFRFFMIDLAKEEIVYSLRTQAAESQILYGVEANEILEETHLTSTPFEELMASVVEKSLIYWTDL